MAQCAAASPPAALPASVAKAAAIAAWHSKQREGGTVAVTGTRARYVAKPKGAKPGTVSIRREAVFRVKPGLPTG